MQINPINVNDALKKIEEHELVGAKLVLPVARFQDIKSWSNALEAEFYEEPSDALKEYMRGFACSCQYVK